MTTPLHPWQDLAVRFSNRGRFGRGSPADALRFASPDRVRAACAALRRGRSESCALPREGGLPEEARTRVALAVAAPRGVVLRGVLLDLPRLARRARLPDGFAVEPGALDTCAERLGVTVEPGDAVLVRTGALGDARARGETRAWEQHLRGPAPGLALGCAAWLYHREVALVAADTAALEVRTVACGADEDSAAQPLRRIAHEQTGVAFGFDFDLDGLAQACAEDGEYAFLLVLPALPAGETDASPVAIR
jgi:hypothetical protein